jgi:DNA modification methylase
MASLPDGCVDMVLTDVPYNEVNRKSGGLRNLDKGIADSSLFSMSVLTDELARLCTGSVYIFCGFRQSSDLCNELDRVGFSVRVGAWHKTNPSPMNGSKMWLSGLELCVFGRKPKAVFNEHCQSALWSCASQRSKIHDTQKPIPLFQRLIEASSNTGHTVLDPFAGSGTTAIAAMNCGRDWICIERDPEYAAKAIERINNHRLPEYDL